MKCSLCLKQAELRNSHIIPEFLFTELYEEPHRFLVVPTSPNEKIRWAQKGFREPLLCRGCEGKINVWETHAKRLIFGGNIKASLEKRHGDYYLIKNVHYIKFKLFQMSLLWRAGVSTLPFFSQVELGPHQERLRQMLLYSNPGKSFEYGCVLMTLVDEDRQSEDRLLEVISEWELLRISGHRCYRFVAGGFVWVFVVSSHAESFDASEFFMTAEGRLVVVRENPKNIEFLRQYAANLRLRLPEIGKFRSKRQRGRDL